MVPRNQLGCPFTALTLHAQIDLSRWLRAFGLPCLRVVCQRTLFICHALSSVRDRAREPPYGEPIRECQIGLSGWGICLSISRALSSLWPVREYAKWRDGFFTPGPSVNSSSPSSHFRLVRCFRMPLIQFPSRTLSIRPDLSPSLTCERAGEIERVLQISSLLLCALSSLPPSPYSPLSCHWHPLHLRVPHPVWTLSLSPCLSPVREGERAWQSERVLPLPSLPSH